MWFSWKLYKICKTACRQRAPYCLCIRVKPCVLFLHTWKIDDRKICLGFTNFWQKHMSRLSMPAFGQTRPENTETSNKLCSYMVREEIPASHRLCVLHWSSAGIGDILSFCLESFDWQLGFQAFSGGIFWIRPVLLSRRITIENWWHPHSILFRIDWDHHVWASVL